MTTHTTLYKAKSHCIVAKDDYDDLTLLCPPEENFPFYQIFRTWFPICEYYIKASGGNHPLSETLFCLMDDSKVRPKRRAVNMEEFLDAL